MALAVADGGTAPEWVQILPSGTFRGRDGRGPYTCDPVAVVARSKTFSGAADMPMDYDHQLEHAEHNGQPAPAAGWIADLEAREDGVWGRVDWTPKGKAHVEAREYRYVSPVYYHDKSGEIVLVESVALTNLPNLTSLKALASCGGANPNLVTGDCTMTFLTTLASTLGVSEADASEGAIQSAVAALVADQRTLKALQSTLAGALQTSDTTADGLAKAAQALSARAEYPDVSKYVPHDLYATIKSELDALKAAQTMAMVDEAKAAGKITPALEGWAKELASRDPEAFRTFAASAPDMRPGNASGAKATPPDGTGSGQLDAMDKALCSALGISEEDYQKTAQTIGAIKHGSADE